METWLKPDWRVELETQLDDGTFTGKYAEEICAVIAGVPGNPSNRSVKQALKACLDTQKTSSAERDVYYKHLAQIWEVIATSPKQYQQARTLRLEWQNEYDKLLDAFFKGSERSDTPGTPTNILRRTLMWIRDGRFVSKGEFYDWNRPLQGEEKLEHDGMLEKIWRLLIDVLKALPLSAEEPTSYPDAPDKLSAKLATLTATYSTRQLRDRSLARTLEARTYSATAVSP